MTHHDTPDRAPVAATEPAAIRRIGFYFTDLFGDHTPDTLHVAVSAAELDALEACCQRQRAVIAEWDAEIERLADENGWLRYWLHKQTGWDIDREMKRAPSVFFTDKAVPDEH